MQEFFERLDSGAYGGAMLIVVGVVFTVLSVWHHITSRRNKAAFFAAQREAQEAFDNLGREDVTTQLKVMEALYAWSVWQHRPTPSFAEIGNSPSPEEYEVLPLIGSLDDQPGQYVQ